MDKSIFRVEGCSVTLYSDPEPEILFLQPVDAHDAELLDRQLEAMRDGIRPFALAAFEVEDWNRDLSPWEAPPVFGSVPFRGGAENTLGFVTEQLMPSLYRHLGVERPIETCLGGYSLAGLFALWASTRTDLFSGVAAASPSVWFPGWMDYVSGHPVRAQTVYLSLGDREERTRNPVMAAVGNCIREQFALLQTGHTAVLEWNPGNHFQDSELRTAKAFHWIARQGKSQPTEEHTDRSET